MVRSVSIRKLNCRIAPNPRAVSILRLREEVTVVGKSNFGPRSMLGRAFRAIPPVKNRDTQITALRHELQALAFPNRRASFMRSLYCAERENDIATDTSGFWAEYAGFDLNKFGVRALAQRAGVKVPEIYGIWETLDEVPWDSLPDSFVVKSLSGSSKHGVVPLVRLGNTWKIPASNLEGSPKELTLRIHENLESGRISGPIFAEQLLTDGTPSGLASDFKIYSFYGQPAVIFIREIEHFYGKKLENKTGYFDIQGNRINTPPRFTGADNIPQLPTLWEKGIETAAEISLHTRLPFVRVDLYEHEGEIYFGELTPRPGHPTVFPLGDDWDEYLGHLWEHAEVRVKTDLVRGHINTSGHVHRTGVTQIPMELGMSPNHSDFKQEEARV